MGGFDKWVAEVEGLLPDFEKEISKGSINNLAAPIQGMKKAVSRMALCIED